jgi:hypothetical protein
LGFLCVVGDRRSTHKYDDTNTDEPSYVSFTMFLVVRIDSYNVTTTLSTTILTAYSLMFFSFRLLNSFVPSSFLPPFSPRYRILRLSFRFWFVSFLARSLAGYLYPLILLLYGLTLQRRGLPIDVFERDWCMQAWCMCASYCD